MNSRPLVYKTSALPLSYRGLLYITAAKVLRIYCCYVVLHLCNCAVYVCKEFIQDWSLKLESNLAINQN